MVEMRDTSRKESYFAAGGFRAGLYMSHRWIGMDGFTGTTRSIG